MNDSKMCLFGNLRLRITFINFKKENHCLNCWAVAMHYNLCFFKQSLKLFLIYCSSHNADESVPSAQWLLNLNEWLNIANEHVILQMKSYCCGWRYSECILIASVSIIKPIKRLPKQDNSLNILFSCISMQEYKIPLSTMTLFLIYFN